MGEMSRVGDAGSGDDRKDPSRVFRSIAEVVRKVIRSQATEFRYDLRQPLPRIDPWRDQLDQLSLRTRVSYSMYRSMLIFA
jgi:hypothetical protein